jgi:hypothetical protein
MIRQQRYGPAGGRIAQAHRVSAELAKETGVRKDLGDWGSSGPRGLAQAVRTVGVDIDSNPAINTPGLTAGDLGRFRNRPALDHQENRLDTSVRVDLTCTLQGLRKMAFIVSIKATF